MVINHALLSLTFHRCFLINRQLFACEYVQAWGYIPMLKLIATSRYTAWWPLRHSAHVYNHRFQIITKRSISAGGMYSTVCVKSNYNSRLPNSIGNFYLG